MIKTIKNIFKYFFYVYSTPTPIQNDESVLKAKRWLKKVAIIYSIFAAAALLLFFVATFKGLPFPTNILFLPLFALAASTFASMALYFKQMVKTIYKAAKFGYAVGDQIRTTHVTVTYEYSNTYKATSHTESKGLLFALIAGLICYMCWGYFCMFVAPFLTVKKIKATLKNIREYEIKALTKNTEATEIAEN